MIIYVQDLKVVFGAWNIGILVFWNDGISVFWILGMLELRILDY